MRKIRQHLFLVYAALLLGGAGVLVIWMILSPDAPPDPATKPLPLPSGFRAELLSDRSSDGAVVFIKTCGQCHDLPNPKLHSTRDWPSVVSKMARHLIVRKAFYKKPLFIPNDAEYQRLVAYLAENGIRPMPAHWRDLSPAATLFKARCAQCHALPDPAQHTMAEWPGVVTRMRQNIQRLQDIEKSRRIPISNDEAFQIIAFLSKLAKPSD